MEYIAVIRTLGTSREKFEKLLRSLHNQTILPQKILVYIAEGYTIPNIHIGLERYIYVKKGMMAQRALTYDEVDTEYMLFLDDDLYLPEDSVEQMFFLLKQKKADVISPDIFPNAKRPFKSELMMTLSARMRARYKSDSWGYRVMLNGGYSYAKYPKSDVLFSETNAGACFLCKKKDFLRINLRDELWIDAVPYAQGDDQVIYYKMHLNGCKILTWYTHGVIHLDGGQNYTPEKKLSTIYSDFRFKTIFWYRFIYKIESNFLKRLFCVIAFSYTILFTYLASLSKFEWKVLKVKHTAIKEAINYIFSKDFRKIGSVII